MYPVLSPDEMRVMDRWTIHELGLGGRVLMELAGREVFCAARELAGGVKGEMVVVAGVGNNGGDGFVAARWWAIRGGEARVFLLGPKEKPRGEAADNMAFAERLGVRVVEVLEPSSEVEEALARARVVVDAIFGTGFRDQVAGVHRWAIEAINRAQRPVVAVDIPSGVNGADGSVGGVAVEATVTVTMAHPKLGHLLYPGKLHVGRLRVADIGIPGFLASSARRWVLEPEDVRDALPPRLGPEHKARFGRLLVVAGSARYSGAALLCGLGALRMGVGLLYLGVPRDIFNYLIGKIPEAILVPLPSRDGHLAPGVGKAVEDYGVKFSALALGPGLGRTPGVQGAVAELLELGIPTLVDADGIWAARGSLRPGLVLTPHPGEASLLVDMAPDEIDRRRVEVAEALARDLGGVVLLKGAPSVIASPERTLINPTGNPGMAVGGSGDVLSGMIGALLAQGLEPQTAAGVGAYLHGLAGDLAARELSMVAMTPWDLAEKIPSALREVGAK